MSSIVQYSLSIDDNNNYSFLADLSAALSKAELEKQAIDEAVIDCVESIEKLTPECDMTDFILAVCSGALCGVIDVFLVGAPGESPIGKITDKWFLNRTEDFAKLCGWNSKGKQTAIEFLEKKYKVPYDQSVMKGAAKEVFGLTPSNHHFKSLAHSPSLLGLFFSILDQFYDESHFVTDGQLIILHNPEGNFKLRGNNVPSKLLFGIVNWIGHLISDNSGSSSSKGRGMGIPSPLWTWMNDVIAIKNKLGIPVSEFDKAFNDLALEMYKRGYDARFQTAQLIPVFVNEMVVRLFYSIRRMLVYFENTEKDDRSFKALWESCEPFSNTTIKRMLTVAHGTFCLVDLADAIARAVASGGTDIVGAVMRVNIVGVGRFGVSLYGEGQRAIRKDSKQNDIDYLLRERRIVEYYINGLEVLGNECNDQTLTQFVASLKDSDAYKQAFADTSDYAINHGVPENIVLKTKSDIDAFFGGSDNE